MNQIRKVLDQAGYIDDAATEENLINCFLDYVDSGQFGNLDLDEAREEIEDGMMTVRDIIRNMNIITK